MKTVVLYRGVIRRHVIETFRYSFELVSMLVLMYVIFVFIFFGARALIGTGADAQDTLSAVVVGYFVWMLAIMSYGSTAGDATQEATAGTLEQMALSPFGLARVLTAKFVAELLVYTCILSVLLVAMMATSGRWLHIDVFSIVPLLVLTLAGVFGVGLMLGGVAIVFKRVQSALQIVQFLFVGMVAVPVSQVPALRYLPLSWGNDLLRRVMVGEASILQIPAGDLLFLLVHACVWVAAGYAVFGVLEKAARQRALLGHY